MNLTEIKRSLDRMLSREFAPGSVRNIVFWYDEDGVFYEDIDSLALDKAKVIKVYHNNMFAIKLYIEETDCLSNLLVYSPQPRPPVQENWLEGTIHYSQIFSTDETSNNLLNYKMNNSLRNVMERYKLFFRNADRSRRFESYDLSPYTEAGIHLGVLSTLCKLPAPNLDHSVQTLLIEMARGESVIYDSIAKFGSMVDFWGIIKTAYGYSFEDQSLQKLAILLLLSHFSRGFAGSLPDEWKNYDSNNPNCYVFTDNLMKNSQLRDDYNSLADFVAGKLDLVGRMAWWTMDDISDCDTFKEFDLSITKHICENIMQGAGEYDHYRKIINSRKNRRYYPQFTAEYDILFYACEYMQLAKQYSDLPGSDVTKLFENYVNGYFKMDSSYRHFIFSFDRLTDNDGFAGLFELVENSYTNWFLNELSIKWCNLWDDMTTWQIPGVTSQQGFYDKYVRRYIADNSRLVVIISDGLRYESAQELNAILNREQKGSSELDVMLGVIPSYTAMGMASLLPRDRLAITDDIEILVDGISTQGTENRGKILKTIREESIAITYDDVQKYSKQQLIDAFSGMKLIYIYHDAIDARGEVTQTENEVFDATEKAFKDLNNLVRRLRNDISAINIIITSDHGYIYRRTPLFERDKTPAEDNAAIETKRRYLLTKEKLLQQGTQCFSMDYLTKDGSSLNAVIPRGVNCFRVKGSSKCYVHGGSSLQEVVIPVIHFKSDKNLSRSMGAKKVTLSLTNISRKITGVITHLSFFQNEPADEKHLPLRVMAYFADEDGNRISNENIIIADSRSAKPEERTYKEKFTLKDMAYDKSKNYYLILKDEEELVNSELARVPFIIELLFGSVRF